MTLGVGSLECELQLSVEGMAPGARTPLLVSIYVCIALGDSRKIKNGALRII